jgi:hypothetical protein
MKDPAVAHPMNVFWDDMQHEPANELFSRHRLGRADLSLVALVLDRYIAVLIDQDPIVRDGDPENILASIFEK